MKTLLLVVGFLALSTISVEASVVIGQDNSVWIPYHGTGATTSMNIPSAFPCRVDRAATCNHAPIGNILSGQNTFHTRAYSPLDQADIRYFGTRLGGTITRPMGSAIAYVYLRSGPEQRNRYYSAGGLVIGNLAIADTSIIIGFFRTSTGQMAVRLTADASSGRLSDDRILTTASFIAPPGRQILPCHRCQNPRMFNVVVGSGAPPHEYAIGRATAYLNQARTDSFVSLDMISRINEPRLFIETFTQHMSAKMGEAVTFADAGVNLWMVYRNWGNVFPRNITYHMLSLETIAQRLYYRFIRIEIAKNSLHIGNSGYTGSFAYAFNLRRVVNGQTSFLHTRGNLSDGFVPIGWFPNPPTNTQIAGTNDFVRGLVVRDGQTAILNSFGIQRNDNYALFFEEVGVVTSVNNFGLIPWGMHPVVFPGGVNAQISSLTGGQQISPLIFSHNITAQMNSVVRFNVGNTITHNPGGGPVPTPNPYDPYNPYNPYNPYDPYDPLIEDGSCPFCNPGPTRRRPGGNIIVSIPCDWVHPPPSSRNVITTLVYVYEEITDRRGRYTADTLPNQRVVHLDLREAPVGELFHSPVTEFMFYRESPEPEHHHSYTARAHQQIIMRQVVNQQFGWTPKTIVGWENCCPDDHWYSHGCIVPPIYCPDTGLYFQDGPCTLASHPGCFEQYECPTPIFSRGPSPPEWIEFVSYNRVSAGTVNVDNRYDRELVQLVYYYFIPKNLVGGWVQNPNAQLAEPSLYVVGRRLGASTIQAQTVNPNPIIGFVTQGLDNNIPIPFYINFPNRQFGIPLDSQINDARRSGGFTLHETRPLAGVYPYEVQYFWSGIMTAASHAVNLQPPVTSLEFEGIELPGRQYFVFGRDFPGGHFALRSIRVGDYVMGSRIAGEQFWMAEFEMGMKYRYGIRYEVTFRVGNMNLPDLGDLEGVVMVNGNRGSHTIHHREWHQNPDPTFVTFTAALPTGYLYIPEFYFNNINTWELQNNVRQPILYGFYTINAVGGVN